MANASQLKQDLNALQAAERARKSLSSLDPRGSRPATTGTGTFTPPASAGTGGIASPLKEEDASKREYYEDQLIPSTDGLAWLRLKSVKKLVMKDGDGAEVVMEFANGLSE